MYKIYTKEKGMPIGHIHKIWLIMRLTTVLLIASLMQVSAAGLAQKISMSKFNAPLKTIIRDIRAQSGYDFVYSEEILKDTRPVTIEVRNADFEEVLKLIFKDQPLVYTIDSKVVIVKEKSASYLDVVKDKLADFLRQDSVVFKGQVLNEYGEPLPGASIRALGSKKVSYSTDKGAFLIYAAPNAKLQVSYVGYATQELQLRKEDAGTIIKFNMKPAAKDLTQVDIVSNGYQDIPKERSTGVFEHITKEQLQHSTDPNLLRRLEGITTSMDFRNDLLPTNSASRVNLLSRSPLTNLTIRGRNTLGGSTYSSENNSGRVLVVIDGIASPYSIDQVNPNDVESITILKDAAAASIWGSRAANGVIVVKTKRGSFQSPLQVSFNANLDINEKLDPYYKKKMSMSDYIDAQITKYGYDYPGDNVIPDPTNVRLSQAAVSPVTDIANRLKMGKILPAQAQAELDVLRGSDVRDDLQKYFFRNAVTQSYSAALTGGSRGMAQRFSFGYNKTLNNTVASDRNRAVVNYGISVRPLAKLDLNANIVYSRTQSNSQSATSTFAGEIGGNIYPYNRLADAQGNPVAITKTYSPQLLDLLAQTYGDKLLSYEYKPLQDIYEGYNRVKDQNLNVQVGATYKVLPYLSANVSYNYNTANVESIDLARQTSWYMRDLINKFTNPVDAFDLNIFNATGTFVPVTPGVRNLPLGGQYTTELTRSNNQTLRGQLNFDKTWNEKHAVSAMAGMDVFNYYRLFTPESYFGYNEENLSTARKLNYNYDYLFLLLDPVSGGGSGKLSEFARRNIMLENRDRTISYFTNAAYTFDQRYTVTASFRRDLSALFSLRGNNGGTPFYSVGAGWNIDREKFYHFPLLPVLRLRATFGYNGNTNPAASPQPILFYNPTESVFDGNMLGFSDPLNASNYKLRPEKTGMLNLGLDFGFRGGRLSGYLNYYVKKTSDLLATNVVDATLGFDLMDTNLGNLLGRGIELGLNSLNVQSGRFRWNSNFLFSYNTVKVTKLYSPIVPNAGETIGSFVGYTEGYSLSRAFAYRWAGLDPKTGDPRGYLNGEIVTISNDEAGNKNLDAIKAQPVSSLRYYGSLVPVYYGSFRNTFAYRNFSVSANLMYKLGYYFRRPVPDMVNYSLLYQSGYLQGPEYGDRWQNPGDEKSTNVPSPTYPNFPGRDGFYGSSEINMFKGDHIRLQEVNLSYTLTKNSWFIKNPRFFANVANLGVIWRANKLGLDPEAYDYPIPKTYSFGFSANF